MLTDLNVMWLENLGRGISLSESMKELSKDWTETDYQKNCRCRQYLMQEVCVQRLNVTAYNVELR